MPIRSRTLKQQARQALRAASFPPPLATLIFLLLTTFLVEGVNALLPDDSLYSMGFLSLFLTVLLVLYRPIMEFGYSCWALETARGEDRGPWSLLDGFGMVGKVLLTEVRIVLGILGRGMLLLFSYSIVLFALTGITSPTLSLLLILLVTAAFYLSLISLTLRYSLARFVLYDQPQAGSMVAVHRSLELMNGHIWSLCKLYLSFWPWYLLQTVLGLAVLYFTIAPELIQTAALYAAGDLEGLLILVQHSLYAAMGSPVLTLCLTPLQLLLLPYQTVALANFYRALSPDPAPV